MQEIIGLTGNIATGKSVIRRMLANCGALEIDADLIAHRVMYPEGAVFLSIIETFGEAILTEDGHISRGKLAEIVFSDPKKLQELEAISHPAVTDAIMARIRLSQQSMVVIEAIKLIEAGLGAVCSSVWVSTASQAYQLERLIKNRAMTEPQAQSRISAQPAQLEKTKLADAVINTEDSFQSTWEQVQAALKSTVRKKTDLDEVNHNGGEAGWASKPVNQFAQGEIEAFWFENQTDHSRSFYEESGSHMLLPALKKNQLSHIITWDNWNFSGTLRDVFPKPMEPEAELPVLDLFEKHAKNQQCEILLIPFQLVQEWNLPVNDLGYQYMPVAQITYPAWQQACQKIMLEGEQSVWIKFLAQPMEQVEIFKIT